MEKKLTSVDQFAIALYEGGFLQGNGDEIQELLDKYKAVHQEEIETSFWDGGQEVPVHGNACKRYYEENYGKEETN